MPQNAHRPDQQSLIGAAANDNALSGSYGAVPYYLTTTKRAVDVTPLCDASVTA